MKIFSKHFQFNRIVSILQICTFILFLFFSLTVNAEVKVIRMGAFNYYPAIFKDKDNVIKGFYVDALSEIEKKENIRFEYIYGSWKEGMERLRNGSIDVMPSVAYSLERSTYLDYTQTPLLTVWGELYVPSKSEIDGINGIKNKKIAIMSGDINALHFVELVKKFGIPCAFIEMSNFEEIFKAISQNKVDAGIVNNTYGSAKQREFNIRSSGVVFNPFDIFFAVKKSTNQDILNLLDSYLAKWKYQENSVFNKSRQKWSHGNVGQVEVFPEWLYISLLILLILVLISSAFAVLLRIQIKKATKDILKKKQILRENEAKFRSYIDNSPDGIFITDENGRYLEVNPAASRITGYSENELLSMSIPDLQPIETANDDMKHFNKLKENGQMSAEFIFQHKSGQKYWWNVDGVKLSETRYMGFVKDITERKKAEMQLIEQTEKIRIQNEELQKAKEKAEESDRLKTAFLQNMSHEIRTPMNAIMGFSDILVSSFNDKEKLTKYSSIIKQRGADLVEIINGILDIAKIESGQLPLFEEECNLYMLFKEIEAFFSEYQARSNKQDIIFKLNVDKLIEHSIVIIDQIKLKQILINLISNAFKFTHTGSITLTCKLDNKQNLLFCVKDTGIGIESSKHSQIFERFIQANNDTSKFYGGTGLGLSIVQGLLNLMKGRIWLESNLKKGSAFYFSIPFEYGQSKKINAPQNNEITNLKNYNATLLIVEDDEFNAEFLIQILLKYDFIILYAENGKRAIELINTEQIDLALVDIRLPDISGFDVIKEIKRIKPNVKIIAQTAYASNTDKEKVIDAGSDEYISKPIKKELLMSIIEYLLIKPL